MNYQKRTPHIVQAIQVTNLLGRPVRDWPKWLTARGDCTLIVASGRISVELRAAGTIYPDMDDWLVRDGDRLYAMKPDDFDVTYEPVPEEKH